MKLKWKAYYKRNHKISIRYLKKKLLNVKKSGMKNKGTRKNIPKKDQLLIWKRDNWHCRYCHKPVFYSIALKLFNKINPKHEYFHPNGKAGEMLQLFQWSWATVDHIVAFSHGGKDCIENYATACWECNLKYNDTEIGKGKPVPKGIVQSNWDGFYGIYKILGEKRP